MEQPFFDPLFQIDADGAHVAHDLVGRLLEEAVEAALAAAAGGIGKVGRDAAFAASGRARYQDGGTPVEALVVQHGVEFRNTGGDKIGGHLVPEADGGDRNNREAPLVEQKGIFVGAVDGAAVFDDAQMAGGDLVRNPLVEQDHAVGDILLQPVARQGAVAALAGDDRGDPPLLEPAEEPPQLGTQYADIGQGGKERLEGIEHHPFGADGVDGIAKSDEKSLQVVFAGLLDLAADDAHMVDGQPLFGDQRRHVKTQGVDVLGELFGALLEGDENAVFAILHRPLDQELHPQQRLARSGTAAHQRRPSLRQAAVGDLVQSRYAGGAFFQNGSRSGFTLLADRRHTHSFLRCSKSALFLANVRP